MQHAVLLRGVEGPGQLLVAAVEAICDPDFALVGVSALFEPDAKVELMGVPQHGLDDLREMVSSAVTTGSRAFLAYISPKLQGRLSWVLQHPDRLDHETVAQLQQAITRLRYQRGAPRLPSGCCWPGRRSRRPSGGYATDASPSVSARGCARWQCRC